METLIFQLQGPFAAWGDAAVGEYRPSAEYPSQSAILGLLAAALGIEREDQAAQDSLRAGCRMAVGLLSPGRLLRDYHTAQVPGRADLKKRPHATRRDELSLPKQDLNTILSTRDYRQEASAVVALLATEGAHYGLSCIAEALRRPRFVLYLGRKSCPPAAPLHPQLIEAPNIGVAMAGYVEAVAALAAAHGLGRATHAMRLRRIAWGDDLGGDDTVMVGRLRDFSVLRKDHVLARKGWQFGDRGEHIALLEEE